MAIIGSTGATEQREEKDQGEAGAPSHSSINHLGGVLAWVVTMGQRGRQRDTHAIDTGDIKDLSRGDQVLLLAGCFQNVRRDSQDRETLSWQRLPDGQDKVVVARWPADVKIQVSAVEGVGHVVVQEHCHGKGFSGTQRPWLNEEVAIGPRLEGGRRTRRSHLVFGGRVDGKQPW
jgi:hypothetical protein